MILVSACLLGENCKYNGGNNLNENIISPIKNEEIIQICPEVEGGLLIPRSPAEIVGGDGRDVLEGNAKVMNKEGKDVTKEFIQGARIILQIAKSSGATKAILKSNSPSCGSGQIYDGTFTGKKISGDGVTAALLKQNGIEVVNE
ncbi:MAG: DUF523 domain-containing protein [Peptostreptococcales bacterium]